MVDDQQKFILTYPNYATKAFYLTYQNIQQLEKSHIKINQGNNTIIAIGLWFLSIEAYINAILKIICISQDKSFLHFKGKDINTRLGAIFNLLEIEPTEFYKSGVFQKFEEFKTFRNEIFHDRTIDGELTFSKTNFSPYPYLANQADTIQAASIAYDFFYALRYIFKSYDLMPNIYIKKEDSFSYVKYDILYLKILKEYFEQVLHKHNLESTSNLNPINFKLNQDIQELPKRINFCLKSKREEKLNHKPNNEVTLIGNVLFDNIKRNIKIRSGTFHLPNYNR